MVSRTSTRPQVDSAPTEDLRASPSEARTQNRYRIRGYLSTAIKHGHNAMQALHDAILGRPWLPPSPVPA